jgi:DNA-binding transcriptional LysR family regulator
MFQLRHLRTFLAAAQTLSFTRAGELVHLSQPGVTEQIRALEHAVGRALFVRQNNRLELTAAGEALVVRARELLALADDALQSVRDEGAPPAAALRLAAPAALCAGLLAPLAGGLLDAQPRLRLLLQEMHSAATAQAVAEGAVDLGVVHGWPQRDDVQAERIGTDHPVVVMPAGHALAGEARVAADALAAWPLLLTGSGCRYRAYLDGLLAHASVPPRVRAEAGDVRSLLQMAERGLGVAVLPSCAVPATAGAQGLLTRPLDAAASGLPVCLLTRAGAALGRPAAGFAALLRERCNALDQPVAAFDVQHRAGRVAVFDQE